VAGKQRAAPALASPELLAKLQKAADAAGCTLQELADLVFESGVKPVQTTDGITQVYTLEDLGKRLWGTMQSVPKSERAAWFKQLVPTQQTAVVVVLRDQGFRTEVIARELELNPLDVVRTWNLYAGELGAQVVGIRLNTIAGQLQLAAERAQEMAIEKNDHKGYWNIQKELVGALQTLGIVDQAVRRVEVTHKLNDQQKEELDRLATLRSKQSRRRIEVEELQTTEQKGDALPADVSKDYDAEDDADDDES
jgi:hypothetical protein